MSLLSNPNPVRLGKFQSWLSPWYENNLIYSSLIYTDLYVNEFLNGIYYKLKVPTSTPIIRELGYQQLMISLKSYISLNKKNMHIINNYKYLNHFKYKHRKIFFYFRRILRNLKKNNFYIFKKNKVKTKGRNVFYLFPSIFLNKNEGIKKTVNISNSTYKINKNNKLKYLSVINQLYYNLFNKKKIKKNKLKKNILLFIRKNKLKNIWNSLIAENKILIKKLKNKNFDKNIKVKNSFSILKNINFRKKNKVDNLNIKKKYMFNLFNKINSHKNKRKLSLFLYKSKINRSRKNKTNSIIRKISFIRNNNRRRIVKSNKLREKKIYNYYRKKNIFFTRNNTQVYLLFTWFFYKIINWLYLLIIQSIIVFFMFKGLLNSKLVNDKKYNKLFIFNWEKKIENRIKLFLSFIKNKKLFQTSNLIIDKNNPFINSNKIDLLNLYKKKFNYNRIKSYYRLKKRMMRMKKKKEYELKYSPKIHNLYFRLLNTTKKWFKSYYRMILLNQLRYKIGNTLSNYLYQPVLYIYSYRESIFPRLDSPKLLCDYIRFLMKKEEKIPSIFKKIVGIHSRQSKKSRKRSYFLMRLLFKFRKKILLKLKSSNIKYKKLNNIIYVKKRIENILKKGINKKNKQMKKYKLKQYLYNVNRKFIINRKNKVNNLYYNIRNKNNNINKKEIVNNNFLLKKNDRIDLKNILNDWKFKFRDLSYKRYPLIGIRIEFNGPVKKGQRTKMHIYNEWVDFYTLPGKMPLVTVMTDIQYWQSYGLTQRAAVGIKLWMYFFSLNYSQTSKRLLNKE